MRRRRGFTLLELLIALALVGLMVSLLFGALRFASRAWDRGEARLERDTRITALWHYLGDRLRRARPLSAWVPDAHKAVPLFTGRRRALEFVAPMPPQLGSGGLYIQRLQEARRDGHRVLLLRRWYYHPEVLSGEAGVPPWHPLTAELRLDDGARERPELRAWYSESVLVDDLRRLRFDYFGPREPGDTDLEWQDQWHDRRRLPRLVRLRLRDGQGDWPVFLFPLPES